MFFLLLALAVAGEAGIRHLLVFDRHGLDDGTVMSRSGIAASRKMADILEAWLEVTDARERAEDGARFRLLFGAVVVL